MSFSFSVDSLVHGKLYSTFLRVFLLPLHFCTHKCLFCIRKISRQLELILVTSSFHYVLYIFLCIHSASPHPFPILRRLILLHSNIFSPSIFIFLVFVFSPDFVVYGHVCISNSFKQTSAQQTLIPYRHSTHHSVSSFSLLNNLEGHWRFPFSRSSAYMQAFLPCLLLTSSLATIDS